MIYLGPPVLLLSPLDSPDVCGYNVMDHASEGFQPLKQEVALDSDLTVCAAARCRRPIQDMVCITVMIAICSARNPKTGGKSRTRKETSVDDFKDGRF